MKATIRFATDDVDFIVPASPSTTEYVYVNRNRYDVRVHRVTFECGGWRVGLCESSLPVILAPNDTCTVVFDHLEFESRGVTQ